VNGRRRHAVLAVVFAKLVTAPLLYLSTCPILVVEARAPPHCASACGHTCGFVGTAAAAAASSHRRRQHWQQQQGDAQRQSLGNAIAAAATKSAAAASSSSPDDEDGCVGRGGNDDAACPGQRRRRTAVRLNKALGGTHSRRAADRLIGQGRVSVNGAVASLGARVDPAVDVVRVDGALVRLLVVAVGQEDEEDRRHPGSTVPDRDMLSDSPHSSEVEAPSPSSSGQRLRHEYVKYWKPVGVTCTCDVRVPGNLVEALLRGLPSQKDKKGGRDDDGGSGSKGSSSTTIGRRRLFPVGRLDRDTSGLLLLTSDGRLPNAVLRAKFQYPKTYRVTLDRPIDPPDVDRLRRGVVITTETSRPPPSSSASTMYRRRAITARTLPAHVDLCDDPRGHPNEITLTLTEGRNRQVRKMVAALGHSVVRLHRTSFLSIGLDGLEGPGDCAPLTGDEMDVIQRAIRLYRRGDSDEDEREKMKH
jgi:pseudouridine synthase